MSVVDLYKSRVDDFSSDVIPFQYLSESAIEIILNVRNTKGKSFWSEDVYCLSRWSLCLDHWCVVTGKIVLRPSLPKYTGTYAGGGGGSRGSDEPPFWQRLVQHNNSSTGLYGRYTILLTPSIMFWRRSTTVPDLQIPAHVDQCTHVRMYSAREDYYKVL